MIRVRIRIRRSFVTPLFHMCMQVTFQAARRMLTQVSDAELLNHEQAQVLVAVGDVASARLGPLE